MSMNTASETIHIIGVDSVIYVAPGAARAMLMECLRDIRPSRIVYVSDENVDPILWPNFQEIIEKVDNAPVRIILSSGERVKAISSLERILQAAVQAPADRYTLIVAVGGGVVTDMAGLAAGLLLRGVRWVAVPTTTLAMADAAIGGKTAANIGNAKNAVGLFHFPTAVIVDPTLAITESERAYRSGLAEVVKAICIGDASAFRALSEIGRAEMLGSREPMLVHEMLSAAIRVKADIVGRDPREANERMYLNFGHTVGHGLEAAGDFFLLTHGETVALGMVAELQLGVRLGITPPNLETEIVQVMERAGLPVTFDPVLLHKALPFMRYDKKRKDESIRMVFLRAIGQPEIIPVTVDQILQLIP